MANTKAHIRKYLQETLAATVSPKNWQPSRRLPLFLREGYTYYEMEFLGSPCLLMSDNEKNRSAATVRKHVELVCAKWGGDIIYMRDQVNSHERKRLIEQKVSFIVPGNQMYLPMLGVDLREHFRHLRESRPTVSPATQAAVLLLLLSSERMSYTSAELADRLGYSKMTISRAFNELKAGHIGVISHDGRQRRLEFDGERQSLWERIIPLLSSPVKHRHHIRTTSNRPVGIKAGLTALARYSMLAAPAIPVVAVASGQWTAIKYDSEFSPAAKNDPESIEVEVWNYDPELFAEETVADRFSLLLSLKDDEDERVQSALEEMMEAVSW